MLVFQTDDGCKFCQLILGCFKGAPTGGSHPSTWPEEWLGPDCKVEDSIYALAKEMPDSNVRISIGSDNVYIGDTIEKVSVFNTLLVKVGPNEIIDEDDPDEEYPTSWDLPELVLDISTSIPSMIYESRSLMITDFVMSDKLRFQNRGIPDRPLLDGSRSRVKIQFLNSPRMAEKLQTRPPRLPIQLHSSFAYSGH